MPALALVPQAGRGPPQQPAAPKLKLALERREDGRAVDRLVAAAFGPGRYAKTAERLREGNALSAACSWCAWSGGELVGAVRTWPVRIGGARALFLGPIAVDVRWRRRGLGALLVDRACEASYAGDGQVVVLVGDLPFFGPLGFEPAPPGLVVLPGPVDPRRVLWRALTPGALTGVEGAVRPAEARRG